MLLAEIAEHLIKLQNSSKVWVFPSIMVLGLKKKKKKPGLMPLVSRLAGLINLNKDAPKNQKQN